MHVEDAVEELEDIGKASFAINDDGMIVVAHGAETDDPDAESIGTYSQAINEGVRCRFVRPHKETAF